MALCFGTNFGPHTKAQVQETDKEVVAKMAFIFSIPLSFPSCWIKPFLKDVEETEK